MVPMLIINALGKHSFLASVKKKRFGGGDSLLHFSVDRLMFIIFECKIEKAKNVKVGLLQKNLLLLRVRFFAKVKLSGCQDGELSKSKKTQ